MESLDENDSINTLLCIAESLLFGGMGPDDRVSFGLVSVTPSTGEVVYDQFSDIAMRTELDVRTTQFPCGIGALSSFRLALLTSNHASYYCQELG